MRKEILAALLFTASAAVAADVPQTAGYTVTKGDTLWGLAGKFYQNPYAWPKLWDANKSAVQDPNRIYPDQVLTIPGAAETAAPPAAKEQEEPAAAAPETKVPADEKEDIASEPAEENIVPAAPKEEAVAPSARESKAVLPPVTVPEPVKGKRYYSGDGFIVPEDWKTDGAIIGDRGKKLMISAGDTVYVNLGADRVAPGTQCLVYRRMSKVKDPETGDAAGYEVRLVGRLTITDSVEKSSATAKVIASSEPLEVGDMVAIAGK